MTTPTASTTPQPPQDDGFVEMLGNSSPWTELFQADQASAQSPASRAGDAVSRQTADSTAKPRRAERHHERTDSDQRATQDALSATFNQD